MNGSSARQAKEDTDFDRKSYSISRDCRDVLTMVFDEHYRHGTVDTLPWEASSRAAGSEAVYCKGLDGQPSQRRKGMSTAVPVTNGRKPKWRTVAAHTAPEFRGVVAAGDMERNTELDRRLRAARSWLCCLKLLSPHLHLPATLHAHMRVRGVCCGIVAECMRRHRRVHVPWTNLSLVPARKTPLTNSPTAWSA